MRVRISTFRWCWGGTRWSAATCVWRYLSTRIFSCYRLHSYAFGLAHMERRFTAVIRWLWSSEVRPEIRKPEKQLSLVDVLVRSEATWPERPKRRAALFSNIQESKPEIRDPTSNGAAALADLGEEAADLLEVDSVTSGTGHVQRYVRLLELYREVGKSSWA
jgi:hypothetical protein